MADHLRKAGVCVGLAVTLLLAPSADARKRTPVPTSAGLQQARRKAQELQRRLAEARAKVKELKEKEREHVNKLSGLQQKVEQTSMQLEDSRFRLTKAQHQLSRTKTELEVTRSKFEKQRVLATYRLRAIFKYRHVSHWEALLTSPDLVGFLTRYQFLKHISAQDHAILQELDGQVSHIHHLKRRMDHLVVTTANLTESIRSQKTEQEQQSHEEAGIVKQIRSERAAWEAAEEQLERSSRDIEAMIRRLMARRTSHPPLGTGRFTWPAGGRVTSGFGTRVHPIYHVRKTHHGVDFGPGHGASVVAADTGVVLFSGWYDGYGKIVMIDHGADLVTLYGHLSRFSVGAGDRVTRGQLVGHVGSTGLSTGPHLHFEVRRNGTPVNPLGYLR